MSLLDRKQRLCRRSRTTSLPCIMQFRSEMKLFLISLSKRHHSCPFLPTNNLIGVVCRNAPVACFDLSGKVRRGRQVRVLACVRVSSWQSRLPLYALGEYLLMWRGKVQSGVIPLVLVNSTSSSCSSSLSPWSAGTAGAFVGRDTTEGTLPLHRRPDSKHLPRERAKMEFDTFLDV